MTANVEAIIARHTVKRAIVIGPLLVGVMWAIRGIDGAAAAAIGVAVVVANFLASGALLSLAARISLNLYHAAALFGFLLRLGAIALTMLVVARMFDIDRHAFGITAVVSYLGLITLEAVAVARGNERELEWTS